MTVQARPPLARKHTRTTEAHRDAELDTGLRLTIAGEVYEARLGDITPGIAREVRTQVGFGFNRLLQTITSDPDIDVIAAFVWVARRIRGEMVKLEDVEITYADIMSEDFDVDVAGVEPVADAEEGVDPEG